MSRWVANFNFQKGLGLESSLTPIRSPYNLKQLDASLKGHIGQQLGIIEQSLSQPFLKVLFGLSGRSRGSRGQGPLVRELRHNIRFG